MKLIKFRDPPLPIPKIEHSFKGMNLFPYQTEVVESKYKYNLCEWARRLGKTTTSYYIAKYNITELNNRVLFLTRRNDHRLVKIEIDLEDKYADYLTVSKLNNYTSYLGLAFNIVIMDESAVDDFRHLNNVLSRSHDFKLFVFSTSSCSYIADLLPAKDTKVFRKSICPEVLYGFSNITS
jgi:hypothetical protein